MSEYSRVVTLPSGSQFTITSMPGKLTPEQVDEIAGFVAGKAERIDCLIWEGFKNLLLFGDPAPGIDYRQSFGHSPLEDLHLAAMSDEGAIRKDFLEYLQQTMYGALRVPADLLQPNPSNQAKGPTLLPNVIINKTN